jgi:hypothetical protein
MERAGVWPVKNNSRHLTVMRTTAAIGLRYVFHGRSRALMRTQTDGAACHSGKLGGIHGQGKRGVELLFTRPKRALRLTW